MLEITHHIRIADERVTRSIPPWSPVTAPSCPSSLPWFLLPVSILSLLEEAPPHRSSLVLLVVFGALSLSLTGMEVHGSWVLEL